MKTSTALLTALATAGSLAIAAPAFAWGTTTTSTTSGGTTHVHFCNCGDAIGAAMCGTTTGGTTTGGTTTGGTTTGGTTTGGTTTGGTTSGGTSGGKVPEPGMLGLLGLSLVGVGIARRRQRRG